VLLVACGCCCSPTALTTALHALQTTETRYVKKLKATVSAYLIPLEENNILNAREVRFYRRIGALATRGQRRTRPHLPPLPALHAQIAAIFRSFVLLRDVHMKLNEVVQAAAEEDHAAQGVALLANELLLAKDALTDLYTTYARSQPAALDALRVACEARPEVRQALDAIAAADERVRGATLLESLDAPLARASEYGERLLPAILAGTLANEAGYTGVGEGGGGCVAPGSLTGRGATRSDVHRFFTTTSYSPPLPHLHPSTTPSLPCPSPPCSCRRGHIQDCRS
jgi:hypothetical protein